MEEEKKKITFYPVYGIIISVLIIAVMVLHIVLPDKIYSTSEKRNLSSVPDVTINSLLDGSFMNKSEDYIADQFPLRDTFMNMKTKLMLSVGIKESQGVFYCKDGSFIEAFSKYDEDLLEKTISSMNDFNASHDFENKFVLIAPTASSVNKEVLPTFAKQEDQNKYIRAFYEGLSDVTFFETITVFQKMKSEGKLTHYRTDHHWTTEAAFEVYKKNAKRCHYDVGSYTSGVVTSDFKGSLVSKSGYSPKVLDAISIYVNDDENLKTLVTHSDNEAYGSFYHVEALNTDNPYEVFFGGNEPMITIQTTADTERTLLLFKDSYANCFIPFLTENYKMITIIDPRYYTGTVSTLFEQQSFSDVMYIYNASTLSQDQNLWMVLKE